MDKTKSPELIDFEVLMSNIREQTALLKNLVLSEEDIIEETKALEEFNSAIKAQIFSTLNNLIIYQLRGWRELIDE